MNQYVYQSLSNDQIRLVTLLPAADRDCEVICDVNIVRLTKEDIPKYEALSYTWGPARSPAKLRISSENEHSIDITKNLAEALPYIRDPVLPRTLWIDSIAINQKDLKERGQQVQRMADIYRSAERVIIWLGTDDTSSKTVMSTCEFLGTKVEVNDFGSLRCLSDRLDDAHWGDIQAQLPYDIMTWKAIAAFLQRRWFQRLWIWQEIRLAKSNAIIMCGTDTMRWIRLRTLLDCIVYKRSVSPYAVDSDEKFFAPLQNGYNLARNDRMELCELLATMRHARCVDQRDRVYGILGLSSVHGLQIDIRPDYNKPVVDVYMELMMYSAKESKRLDMLSLCGSEQTMDNWPSWVPRLMDSKKRNDIHSFASGYSTCEVELLKDRALRVTGIRLGQITKKDYFHASLRNAVWGIRAWTHRVGMASRYVDGKSMAEAFCHAICGGVLADYYMPPSRSSPSLASSSTVFSNILRRYEDEIVMDQATIFFSGHVFRKCEGRAFFKTSRGHIGIGPANMREGDEICVLLGCDVPMIIRPDSNGRYRIIGESYVSGISSNEAILGRLPRRYREVLRYDPESGSTYWVYLNTETKRIQVGDPRLGAALPSGWGRITDAQGQFWEDFFHESAPGILTALDPRLTKPELLKRGVPLEDIEFS
ncbi:hypothetical protein G6011_08685 [Alternaria panax]|uniref:Heterokaryon incompatibility domain-containing protein n=1 Tax=Alternaria panax TaxID=48097 RepID=A0AAD4FIC4_9PLEO|nr:hypothetical protein G6011_08685 [Alternaria panax]